MATKPTADDESREKFQAALEAKKHKTGHGSGAPAGGSGPSKEHASRSGGKREFRRKSG